MDTSGNDHNRRHSDAVIIAHVQKFSDFIERYDRDVGALNEWRLLIDKKLDLQDNILRDISPVYRRGLWVIGIFIVGSIGIAVTKFWSKFSWN